MTVSKKPIRKGPYEFVHDEWVDCSVELWRIPWLTIANIPIYTRTRTRSARRGRGRSFSTPHACMTKKQRDSSTAWWRCIIFFCFAKKWGKINNDSVMFGNLSPLSLSLSLTHSLTHSLTQTNSQTHIKTKESDHHSTFTSPKGTEIWK
jgi:hypothetical protein